MATAVKLNTLDDSSLALLHRRMGELQHELQNVKRLASRRSVAPDRGPEVYLAKTTDTITGIVGTTTPGSGPADFYRVRSDGELERISRAEEIVNFGGEIAADTFTCVFREPSSGRWVVERQTISSFAEVGLHTDTSYAVASDYEIVVLDTPQPTGADADFTLPAYVDPVSYGVVLADYDRAYIVRYKIELALPDPLTGHFERDTDQWRFPKVGASLRLFGGGEATLTHANCQGHFVIPPENTEDSTSFATSTDSGHSHTVGAHAHPITTVNTSYPISGQRVLLYGEATIDQNAVPGLDDPDIVYLWIGDADEAQIVRASLFVRPLPFTY